MEDLIDKKIMGKVAKIINEYNVVVNIGINSLAVGDVLSIIEEADDVVDPDTKEVLGTVSFSKAKVKVVEVHEKFAVCQNTRVTSSMFPSSLYNVFDQLQSQNEALTVNDAQNDSLSLAKMEISIGDKFYKL